MSKKGKIQRNYIPYEPNQQFLLPPDMSSWLKANHMVYFLINLLKNTDLSAFDRTPTSRRGRPTYHYQMMCGLLLYAYSQGVTSSRIIERKTTEEIPYRILAGNRHPDHNTIANFRKNYLDELSSIAPSLLLKLQQAKYISLDLVSIDGTKMKANASIYENITQEKALKRKQEAEQWLNQKMKEADQKDQEENNQFGSQNPYLGLPTGSYADKTIEELTQEVNKWDHFLDQTEVDYSNKRKLEQQRIEQEEQEKQEQKRELAQEEKANPTNQANQSSSTNKSTKKKRNQQQTKRQHSICPLSPHGDLPPLDYVSNRTDPQSRMMVLGSNHSWVQAFNVELAVDSKHQFIVGVAVTQDHNDQYQLIPMIQNIEKQFQLTPKQVLADAGYCSEKNLTYLLKDQIDPFVATGRPEWMHHGGKELPELKEAKESIEQPEPDKIESSPDSLKENGYSHRLGFSLVDTMKLKLKTELGKDVYKKRGNLSESPFGFIRHVMKFNQFSLRGLQKVQGEANLLILAYNLRKYYRICHPIVVKPRKKNSIALSMG
ncbi:MAG: transposase [candidate division SR1 bacterium]|nr:transposase [candidate division SR1 bacterium]